ncbi:MAG: M20/M25/M40 family metallo-hydrolase [bacterium]|nr:M20/M25/M40 family metallo-hydrolase [bacterium]
MGRPAHAGIEPEKGISAIEVASEAIFNMRRGRIDEETTANVGTIKGGTATNIVAENVEIRFESRSRNQVKLDQQVQHMTDALNAAAMRRGVKVDISIEHSYPSVNLDTNQAVVQLAINAVNSIGLPLAILPTGGGSDANILNGKGMPSIVLGIGMENVHSKEERIAVSQLVDGAKLLLSIINESTK